MSGFVLRRGVSRLQTSTGLISLLLTGLLVVVFAKLGYWQLTRAQEKISMIDATKRAQTKLPLENIDGGFVSADLYRGVKLQGKFDYSSQFLLDNRVYKGQPGYEVLTPFYPLSTNGLNRVILVNRGWLPGASDRSVKPVLDVPARQLPGTVTVAGLLATPSKGFTLGDATDPGQQDWPLVLQYIDYETIARKLDRIGVINAVVISSPDQLWNYTYIWQPVANGPEKHYGYAFQWFAMLAAVLVIFVYLNFIKKDE